MGFGSRILHPGDNLTPRAVRPTQAEAGQMLKRVVVAGYAGVAARARRRPHFKLGPDQNDTFSLPSRVDPVGRLRAGCRPEQSIRALGRADRPGFRYSDTPSSGCLRVALRDYREAWAAPSAGNGPDQCAVCDGEGSAAGIRGGVSCLLLRPDCRGAAAAG